MSDQGNVSLSREQLEAFWMPYTQATGTSRTILA